MVATKRDKQKRMKGTFEPAPEAIEAKATEYADALSERMTNQQTENTLREQLVDLMVEHKVDKCELDDGRVVELVTSPEKRKIKVRTEGDGKGEGTE